MALPTVGSNKGQQIYNNPHWSVSGGSVVQGDKSSVGEQITLDVLIKKALLDAAQDEYFAQMSSTIGMPKHMGKKIKREFELPLLDDRNVSTQGIGADGTPAVGNGKGNLFGSSKNIDLIQSKLPTLTEIGGRVNRVGFTKLVIEADVREYGFFYEFTKDALDFDTNEDLLGFMSREAIRGASQTKEAIIQNELLHGAGTLMYGGAATDRKTMSAETAGSESVVTYKALQRLARILDENRTPKKTMAIYGSRMQDTRVIGRGRPMYVGIELENMLRNMVNAHGTPAFIGIEHYGAAASANIMRGEIGTIGEFRIIVVPRMNHWTAGGAEDVGSDNVTYKTSKGFAGNSSQNTDTNKDYYDVFPMLVVGDDSFTHVGFETGGNGNSPKLQMITKLPSAQVADREDPFGKTGFTSIQWWHGMLIQRPERLAVFHTLAEI